MSTTGTKAHLDGIRSALRLVQRAHELVAEQHHKALSARWPVLRHLSWRVRERRIAAQTLYAVHESLVELAMREAAACSDIEYDEMTTLYRECVSLDAAHSAVRGP